MPLGCCRTSSTKMSAKPDSIMWGIMKLSSILLLAVMRVMKSWMASLRRSSESLTSCFFKISKKRAKKGAISLLLSPMMTNATSLVQLLNLWCRIPDKSKYRVSSALRDLGPSVSSAERHLSMSLFQIFWRKYGKG